MKKKCFVSSSLRLVLLRWCGGLRNLDGGVDAGRGIDAENAHSVHLRHFRDDTDEEDAAINDDVERLKRCSVACDPGQYCGQKHEKLFGGGPGRAGIDLLVQRERVVFSLRCIVGIALNPVENHEGNLSERILK